MRAAGQPSRSHDCPHSAGSSRASRQAVMPGRPAVVRVGRARPTSWCARRAHKTTSIGWRPRRASRLSRCHGITHSAVRVEYDCELLEMVYRMERRMFDEFYARRACPSAKFPAGGQASIGGQALVRNAT